MITMSSEFPRNPLSVFLNATPQKMGGELRGVVSIPSLRKGFLNATLQKKGRELRGVVSIPSLPRVVVRCGLKQVDSLKDKQVQTPHRTVKLVYAQAQSEALLKS